MTRRATILVTVVFFCVVGLATFISASAPGDPQPETALVQRQVRPDADRPSPPDADVADEIFRIREEVDLDIFAGTTWDRDEDSEAPPGEADVFQSKLTDLLRHPLPPGKDVAPTATDGPKLAALVATLRDMSFRVDQVAHRLELQRQYHDADNLRGIAQEVRVVARGLDRPAKQNADAGKGMRPTR